MFGLSKYSFYNDKRNQKNEDEPVFIKYHENGLIKESEMSILNTDNNKPYKIQYYENGSIKCEYFHRYNSHSLPSEILYSENGDKIIKTYKSNFGFVEKIEEVNFNKKLWN